MKCLVFLLRCLFIYLLYNIYIQRREQLLADCQNVKSVARLQAYRQTRGEYVHVLLVDVGLRLSRSLGFVEASLLFIARNISTTEYARMQIRPVLTLLSQYLDC